MERGEQAVHDSQEVHEKVSCKMSCSGFYRALHEWMKWLEREKRFKRRLRKVLRKHGWL